MAEEKVRLVTLDNLQYFGSVVNGKLAEKVDKVEGKGLSANDFTDVLKEKLEAIEEGGQVNIIETVKVNGEELEVTDKAVDITVPTALADLSEDDTHKVATAVQLAQIATNKSDLDVLKADGGDGSIKAMIDAAINAFATELTEDGTVNTYKEALDWIATHASDYTALLGDVANKVDKIAGKGLSTNDVTDELKAEYDAAYTHSTVVEGNPHNVTKAEVGLGNVENKSSETIRGELTSENVTDALGFTPVDAAEFTVAEQNKDGLMSKEDKTKLDSFELMSDNDIKSEIDKIFA